MMPVEPNASRAVRVEPVDAWIAAHLGEDGKMWICRRLADSREWLPHRLAKPNDLELFDLAGALAFPVLLTVTERTEHPDWPTSIPWGLIREYGDVCREKHSLSPLQLAELGGLSPFELAMVFRSPGSAWPTPETAMEAVGLRLDEYLAAQEAAV